MKEYCVTFKYITCAFSHVVYSPYSICVLANGFDDAQEKAIDMLEGINMIHAEITKIEKI